MIVVMRQGCTQEELQRVQDHIKSKGLRPQVSKGEERTVVAVLGQVFPELRDELEVLPGVREVVKISRPYKLSSREVHPDDTIIRVGNVTIGGGGEPIIMAGPCAVENEQQMLEAARAVKAGGAHILRGGAYKPRSSPYSFRGLGVQGLELLDIARQETGLPIITEVMPPSDVEVVARYADILQIGARNMQNYNLLDEVGKTRKPVMLKRGLSGTIEEWLLAAEYILSQGNSQVMLCERGIRTYETYTRNTLDISAVPIIHKLSHLPIIVDPSHGTGKWYLVHPMAMAAVAAGADGVMVEVHPHPDKALSDGAQALTPENFRVLVEHLQHLAQALPRKAAARA